MNRTPVSRLPRHERLARVGLLAIGIHFIVPGISYLLMPEMALGVVQSINGALGGIPSWSETGHLWWMLAIGNVLTLGFLCVLLAWDLRRFFPVLPGLLFLKACSAVISFGIGVHEPTLPVFFAIALLDGSTTIVMAALALWGRQPPAADGSAPGWARVLLIKPHAIERGLKRVASGRLAAPTPNLWQMFLAVVAMWQRVLTRPQTVGTCHADAVRQTTRAKILQYRAFRLPVLLWNGAVIPLDLTGLASAPRRLLTHLLGAHHDGAQLVYDLEILQLTPAWLRVLEREARAVVDGSHPHAAFLRDLCVYEGYHERLLAMTQRALHGTIVDDARVLDDPDLSFTGTLRWCARMPRTPRETWQAWRARTIQFAFKPAAHA